MAIALYALVFVASVANAISVAIAWYSGFPPDWFVWTTSILFSIGVAINCLKDLGEKLS